MREIALDTETTGLSPNSGHKLVEVGAIELIDRLPTGNTFHVYINPLRDVPKEAERVHGLNLKFLQSFPIFKNIAKDLRAFIGDSRLIIHNAAFDMRFLNHEFNNVGMEELSMKNTLCTVALSRKVFPGQPANLDALCKRYGIDLRSRTKHGALIDAQLLAEVYLCLTGGRQTTIFNEEAQDINADHLENLIVLPARAFKASAEDLLEHQKFIETIKDNLWDLKIKDIA